MADETELERLVVKLVGDNEEYKRSLDEALNQTKETAKELESIDIARGVLGAHAIEAAGQSVLHMVHTVIGAWEEQEAANIALEAALTSQGRDVEKLMGTYAEWSNHIQNTTTMADEQAIMLIKTAESFELTDQAAMHASESAIAFGAATGRSAESMIRVTAAMEKGDLTRARLFSKWIPQLRGVKDDTEFLRKYNALLGAGMEVVAKQAGTFGGQLKMLENALSNLYEDFGKMAAEALTPFVTGLRMVVLWISSLSEETKKWIGITAGIVMLSVIGDIGIAVLKIVPIFGLLTKVIKGVASAMWLIVTNPIGLVITGIAVALGAAAYAFLKFTDAGNTFVNWVKTTFAGMGQAFADTIQGMKDAMAAGDFTLAGAIMFKGLEVVWEKGITILMDKWMEFKVWLGVNSKMEQFMINMARLYGVELPLMAQLADLKDKAAKAAEEAGKATGSSFNKGVAKEIGKVESAGVRTAEGMRRVMDYLDTLSGGKKKAGDKGARFAAEAAALDQARRRFKREQEEAERREAAGEPEEPPRGRMKPGGFIGPGEDARRWREYFYGAELPDVTGPGAGMRSRSPLPTASGAAAHAGRAAEEDIVMEYEKRKAEQRRENIDAEERLRADAWEKYMRKKQEDLDNEMRAKGRGLGVGETQESILGQIHDRLIELRDLQKGKPLVEIISAGLSGGM